MSTPPATHRPDPGGGGGDGDGAGGGRARRRLRAGRLRTTTAHLCSIYPWSVEDDLGHRGVYWGTDALSGGGPMFWDPFEAYHHLPDGPTNPNVFIVGAPGNGKSALVKTGLWRMHALYGPARWWAICDPKGEYVDLAHAIGAEHLRLAPGGVCRINPLAAGPAGGADPARRARRHHGLLRALCALGMGETPSQEADAVLYATARHLNTGPHTTPSLADARTLLHQPPPQVLDAARLDDPTHARAVTRPLVLALDRLLGNELAGMFDGTDPVPVNWTAPGLVLDLSAVFGDTDVLSVVMVAATGWLTELMGTPGPQRVQVFDEVWALLRDPAATRHLQHCWKLGRTYGVANIAVCHRPSDLTAQSDDGTALSKIAAGLLADTATKILLRQDPDQLAHAQVAFGLSPAEVAVVAGLRRGESLWRTGERSARLTHRYHHTEAALIDTDARMRHPDEQRL